MPDLDPETTIALVLGAGGAVGGAFIDAALDELRDMTGFDRSHASTIVGTSAGAFRAAGAAPTPESTMPYDAVVALSNAHDWSPRRCDRPIAAARVMGGRVLARLVRRSGEPPGYRVPRPPHHPGAVVVSVGLGGMGRTIHPLSHVADPATAVRASAAVPFAGGPVCIDGRFHTDGAVYSPTNADLCPADGAAVLVAIAPMVARTGGNWLARLHRVQLRRELAPWLAAGKPVIVIAPGGDDKRHPDHVDEFANAGRRAVRRLKAAHE